jgi:[protein-PII] uridylyltransferase
MLLHDTGKGLGDQQIEGMKTARSACKRLGVEATERDLVAWLVGNHLEMSETAQKRDISDPRTIMRFAELVGDLERMRLLYILTIADIRAVGPNVWNTWKGQLLADLYHNTEAVLRGGRTDQQTVANELHARALENQSAVKETAGALPGLLLEMEDPYWTGFDQATLRAHAELLSRNDPTVVSVTSRPGSGGTEVFVSGPDRRGLFSRLAGAIVARGANIISAQVFTAKSGWIVDVFVLQDENGAPFALGDTSRLKRLEEAVRFALEGEDPIPAPKIRPNPRKAAFLVEPSVAFLEDVSAESTVIDLAGRDRPGLLADVAGVLTDFGVSIVSAHVGSYGERVFDAFYVNLPDGFSEEAKESLKNDLLAALGRQEPDAPSTPVRQLKRASAANSF